jgi:hypothetical protein
MNALLCLLMLADVNLQTRVEPLPPPQPWRVEVGMRASWVGSGGYAPFSPDDGALASSLGASRDVLARGPFALAVGAFWDAQHSTAKPRGATATLDAHRFAARLEGRYTPVRWLSLFARAAPGAVLEVASLSDDAVSASFGRTGWGGSLDATAGVQCWLLPYGRNSKFRFWLSFEAGYGWTTPQRLLLAAAESDSQPLRGSPTDLGTLSLQGPIFRVATAVTF